MASPESTPYKKLVNLKWEKISFSKKIRHGYTLKAVSNPDKIVTHEPSPCFGEYRLSELLSDIFACTMTAKTLANTSADLAEKSTATVEKIICSLEVALSRNI